MKKWKILDNRKAESENWELDGLIRCLLENRGFKTREKIESFLQPKLSDVTPGKVGIDSEELNRAIERIKKAIKDKESIIVYSDYDVDGVCGGAIVWETLHKLGAKIMPYIPHRVEEGYGLSKDGIDKLKEKYGAQLIITVDHGISAWQMTKYARDQGIDVIISDHHLSPESLPPASAIVHTIKLSGCGVAWLLAQEMVGRIRGRRAEIRENLDLVAIATIADLVPLVGANRTLVKFGLDQLNQTQRIGLLALIEETGLRDKNIGTWEIGHILGPHINAMGRMAHAIDSLRLLCTRRMDRARQLAFKLRSTNRERQLLTQETIAQAKRLIDKQLKKIIFVHHESYQEGVIGLVAGRLAEKYYRPAIVVAKGRKYSKASARSINGFNIVEAIRKASDLLIDCGGHPMAAGFTIETKKLDSLKERLYEIANQQLSDELLTKTLAIDCQIDLKDIDWNLFNQLEKFEPFGLGNPRPVFASRKVLVEDVWLVGWGKKHLKLQLVDFPEFDVVGFYQGDFFKKIKPGRPLDIAYTLDKNTWNNKTHLQLKIKDIKIPSL